MEGQNNSLEGLQSSPRNLDEGVALQPPLPMVQLSVWKIWVGWKSLLAAIPIGVPWLELDPMYGGAERDECECGPTERSTSLLVLSVFIVIKFGIFFIWYLFFIYLFLTVLR